MIQVSVQLNSFCLFRFKLRYTTNSSRPLKYLKGILYFLKFPLTNNGL